jgi:transcriptional regulator with GAF, ATPase, and Fis domain
MESTTTHGADPAGMNPVLLKLATLERRAANLEALDGLLGALTGVLDIREVFARVSEIASKVLPHDAMGLPLVTDDREHVIPLATVGMITGVLPPIMPLPDNQRYLLTEPWDAHIIEDIQVAPEFHDTPFARIGLRSFLRVPIRLNGRLEAMLGFLSRTPGAYSQADALIARRIADHVALVLSHQRLSDEHRRAAALQERTANLEMLDGLLGAITGVLDVREAFQQISEVASKVLPHDVLTLPTLTEGGEGIVAFATAGLPPGALPPLRPLPTSQKPMLTEPWDAHVIDDIRVDAEMKDTPFVGLGMRSLLRVPIRLGGRLEGVLAFMSRAVGAYSSSDTLIARRIADHIAMVMSHQRLADENRRAETLASRAAALDLFDEALTTVGDGVELRDIIDRVSALAAKVLPHDGFVVPVILPDRKRARRYASSGVDKHLLADVVDVPDFVLKGEWEFDIIEDMTVAPMSSTVDLVKMGFRSLIRVPVRLDGRIQAVVAFLSRQLSAYSPDHVPVARRVAQRMALILAKERGLEAVKRADEAGERAARLEARVRALTEELDARAGYRRVIGKAASWRQALTQATQVAATDTTVLLLGESGTGKEVVARFVHRASQRRDGPYVALNCAALPEHLLEAELFGYERGAFTGATQSKPGQLEQASGGVLFLDEVGEMSLPAQAKFLRVLQEREFQRLGGTRVLRTDARIVAATNRDLLKAMSQGLFREDLYYRLNVFAIRLPALRDRREDILPLCEAFLGEFGRAFGRPPAGVSTEARQTLLEYHWPGNVRELRNILERAAILCDGGLITSEHLAISPVLHAPPVAAVAAAAVPVAIAAPPADVPPPKEDLKSMERAMIEKALQNARFNKSQAAKELGLTRHQLYVRMRRYGLE